MLNFDSNSTGSLLVGYRGLPYLFIFNEKLILETFIKLPIDVDFYDSFNENKSYTLNEGKISVQSGSKQIRSVLTSLILDEQKNIFWHRGSNELFFIDKKDNYKIKKFILDTPYKSHRYMKLFLVDKYLCVTFSGESDILFFDLNIFYDS